MNEGAVSVREFEAWVKHQAIMHEQHSKELNKIAESINTTNSRIQETIVLLRDDVSTTKHLVESHINAYNNDKQRNHETFTKINDRVSAVEETIREQAGVYHSAKAIKFVAIIIITSVCMAWGANLAGYISFSKPEPVKKTLNSKG